MTPQSLRDRQTITAVATPAGVGGISVIRLSGPEALSIVRRIFRLPEQIESHRVYYGSLRDPQDGREIDEVLLTWFSEGRSFTGEPTAEISCHGSPIICQEILRVLIEQGAMAADRGEFTYRAFMNGRIDLVQAESVLSLIESRSAESRRQSLRQLRGDLSKALGLLENDLVWCGAHIEAGIDFSTEDIDVVELEKLRARLRGVQEGLESLASSYRSGRALKEGIFVALVGRPNVGKSSLLNRISGEDRAIVTEIAGTTRDAIEAETTHQGYRFVFTDTAGLRESHDPVERIGIERSRKVLQEADLVLFVLDAGAGVTADDRRIFAELDLSRTLVVLNKSDLLGGQSAGNVFNDLQVSDKLDYLAVSALQEPARAQILERLTERFAFSDFESTAPLMQARHFELVENARNAVERALEIVGRSDGAEFAALDIKSAVMSLHEILGKRFDDQIMDRVFKEFCIGK